MMILSSTDDIIRVVTADSADIESHVSWVDVSAGTITPGRTNTASITTNTTTTILASPASATTYRTVKIISLRNNHATQECTVTVEHYDGATAETLMQVMLRAGEALLFDSLGRWSHYTSNGELYAGCQPVATQAIMETATATTSTVVPSVQVFHPAMPKFWAKFGTAGNLLDSYNVDSVNDDGVGLATVTITADFSTTDWCGQVTTERAATALAVINAREQAIRNTGMTVGTITVESWDHSATTDAAQADPTSWHVTGLGDR